MIDEFGMLEIEIGEGRSLAVTDPLRARRRGGHGPRYRYTVVVQVEPGRFHGHLMVFRSQSAHFLLFELIIRWTVLLNPVLDGNLPRNRVVLLI